MSFSGISSYTVDLAKARQGSLIEPLHAPGWSSRFNIDGLLSIASRTDTHATAYLQLFRNGALESVSSDLIGGSRAVPDGLASLAFADAFFRLTRNAFQLFQILEIPPPISVGVSLLGVKNALLHAKSEEGWLLGTSVFDRDTVIVPEILVDDFAVDVKTAARPIFDALWQAAGFDRCLEYDHAGQWKPRR